MAKNDTYKTAKIIEFPNMVARVQIPVLTPEERNQRMKMIHNAALSLLLSVERGKQ